MYTINLVRYGKVVSTYTVQNIKISLAQLAYISVSNEGNVYNVIMAVKDDCDLTTLSTGSVGEITRGIS